MGTTHFSGLSVTGDLTVGGAFSLTGAISLASTLAVTGAATLSSTLAVTGAVTLSSTLAVTGAATFSDTVTVAADKKLQFGDANSFIKKITADSELSLETDQAFYLTSDVAMYHTAPKGGYCIEETADGTIHDKRLCQVDSSDDLVEADTDTVNVVGINNEGADVADTDPISLGVKGYFTGVADAEVEGGSHLKSCSGGRVGRFITSTLLGTTMQVASAGTAFTNQPANDTVDVVSDDAGDTTQTVTLIGTRNGQGDTVYTEDLSLNGTNSVSSTTYTDWALILAVKMDGTAAGTVTVSENSGSQAITTITTGNTTSGVVTVATETRAFNKAPTIVSDDATTKQVGMLGTGTDYSSQYDSQALNGSTAQTMNSAFNSVTELYVGDLEAARNCTLKVGAADNFQLLVGRAGPAGAASKDDDCIVII